MTQALAHYWHSRFATTENVDDFAADIARVHDALAAGHTISHSDIPADGVLRIHLPDALEGALAPLVVHEQRLWLQRTFHAEAHLARLLLARLALAPQTSVPDLSHHTRGLHDAQAQAVEHGMRHALTLITGGPGTGKTYTVARLVNALLAHHPDLRIALAAPTGKAAQRLQESLAALLPDAPLPAQTLHRLLGITRTARPHYHAARPLPLDVLIVDEASMLSLELAHALFAALAPHTRLILLGDADQLAAVDPGAVLHDLCQHPRLQAHIVRLTASQRFSDESAIGQLAAAILAGDSARAHQLLERHPDLDWQRPDADTYARLFAPYQPFIATLQQAAPERSFAAFQHYRILCAGHHGALGVSRINQAMRQAHLRALNLPTTLDWYPGKPVLITANDYTNELYNGDIGLCLPSASGTLQLHFPERAPLPLERINPAHLADAYALTVHKAQGSEFAHIALTLDSSSREHLSRELLYTGITRARERLSLYSADLSDALPVTRSTGLGILLDYLASQRTQLSLDWS